MVLGIGIGGDRLKKIVEINLDDESKEMIRVIGIDVGDGISVLRRSPLGNLVHVRVHHGAEFAIEARTAEVILVECGGGNLHPLTSRCPSCNSSNIG